MEHENKLTEEKHFSPKVHCKKYRIRWEKKFRRYGQNKSSNIHNNNDNDVTRISKVTHYSALSRKLMKT